MRDEKQKASPWPLYVDPNGKISFPKYRVERRTGSGVKVTYQNHLLPPLPPLQAAEDEEVW